MNLDGTVDLVVDPVTALHVVGGKPAAYPFVLKVCVQSVGEFLIFSRIALSDLKMIDDDVVEELHNEAASRLISDVSYPQLMDIFWRHDAYTRTLIKGSDLADLIGKIAQLPIDDDGGYCLRGLRTGDNEIGCDVPQKVDLSALRVNGRFLDPSLIYSLAVPQSLGQKLGLGDHKTARTEMITGIYRFLSSDGLDEIMASSVTVRIGSTKPRATTPTVPAPQSFVPDVGGAGADPPAPPTWKNPYEYHWLGMIYVPPASIEVGGQNYRCPHNRTARRILPASPPFLT